MSPGVLGVYQVEEAKLVDDKYGMLFVLHRILTSNSRQSERISPTKNFFKVPLDEVITYF